VTDRETQAELTAALEACFAALDGWCRRPAAELEARPDYPGAWSAAEHLEHVGLANHYLLLTIGKGCAKALKRAARQPVPAGESDLSRLALVAKPGAFDWPPPAHMLPTGRRKADEVREELKSQGARCRELLSALPRGEGRLCSISLSVLGLGRLDMYQWLYFLAQHARYHLALLAGRPGAAAGRASP